MASTSSSSSSSTEWSLLEICKKRVMNELIGTAHAAVRAINSGAASASSLSGAATSSTAATALAPNQHQVSDWFVLVVDSATLRVVSACCRMFDVMEENITVVENITKARQPLPGLPAVYFLSPTEEIVDALVRDWSQQSGARHMYHSAHVFFSGALPEPLLKKIASSAARPYIKSLKEFNMDFVAFEPRVFHMDSPQSFYNLYSPESTKLIEETERIANRLVTLCVSLQEFPIIRYDRTAERDVPGNIARVVQDKLTDLLRKRSPAYQPSTTQRATLLIVGRSIDAIAPLLSEFTYQAMAYHLLPGLSEGSGGKYKLKYTTAMDTAASKEVLLDDHDTLWPGLRHKHIAEAIQWLIDSFNEFVTANKASAMQSRGGAKNITNLKEMKEAIRAMPQFMELMGKYSLHMTIAQDCMTQFGKRQLARLASLEQDMATGLDAAGQEARNIMSTLPPILTDAAVDVEDKKRLIMLYIISQEGMKEVDRRRMMEYGSLSAKDQAAISNLFYLGVTLNKPQKAGKKKSKARDRHHDIVSEEIPFELSRYSPRLKYIMRDLCSNSLSYDTFPPVVQSTGMAVQQQAAAEGSGGKSGLKSQSAAKWAGKAKDPTAGLDSNSAASVAAAAQPKLIVFVAGGMTYSEMRVCYSVSESNNRNVYIGSTHMLTPQTFVKALGDLKTL